MDALLPDPWDEARVEDDFAVTRIGVLASGRMPAERGMVASWLACTGELLDQWASWGWAVPELRLVRFDPERVRAVITPDRPLVRAREIDTLLRLRLDGNLDLCGHLSGPPPAEPFVYEWSAAAHLEPPDWISLFLDVSIVGAVPEEVRRRITRQVVQVVRTTVADPRIHYAEAGPRSMAHGATPWEDAYDEDPMASGARLAPQWLRGTGAVTYVHDRVVDALGGRQHLGAALVDAEVLPSEEGVVVVARPSLWSEDPRQDARIRAAVAERLVPLDPLLDAVRFAADWVGGPDAASVDAHFATETWD
ncbi:hypothetical protein [Nocardioides sp. LML1-1-1.1]|uniref:hypothetical protein n=1 Tax=Nocardioides sp. LML1-1-1.1 TaxID=3135248 RepID=UPI003432ECF9